MEPQVVPATPPKPEGQLPVVERRITPQMKAAMSGWIPLDTNPIDRYTPAFFKTEYPAPDWPVFEILKPRPSDHLRDMERDPEALKVARQAMAEGRRPELDPVKLARESFTTVRERLKGFSNYKSADGKEIKYEKGGDGLITEACIDRLGSALIIDIHFRYLMLGQLSPMEMEGLG